MKISQLTEITQAASDDYLPILDTSDTTQGVVGSTRRIPFKYFSAGIILSPNGINDDIQIQAAINSLSRGGIIHLKAGDYYIDNTITLNNYITIEGEGREATVIHSKNNINVNMFYTPVASSRWSYIVIRDLALDGNRAHNTTGHGIYLNSCWKLSIERVVVKHSAQNGIRLDGSLTPPNVSTLESHIVDTFITDTATSGFVQGNTFDTYVDDLYIDTTISGSGADILSGSSTFHHLHVFNAKTHGIFIESTASECVFIQCVGDTNTQAGIRLDGNRHILIGCESFNSSQGLQDDHSGIDVTGQYNTVIGCHSWNKQSDPSNQKQKYGIEERANSTADYNIYSNNNLVQNHLGAILLQGSNSKSINNLGSSNYFPVLATGASHSVDDVITVLQNLNLVKQS